MIILVKKNFPEFVDYRLLTVQNVLKIVTKLINKGEINRRERQIHLGIGDDRVGIHKTSYENS